MQILLEVWQGFRSFACGKVSSRQYTMHGKYWLWRMGSVRSKNGLYPREWYWCYGLGSGSATRLCWCMSSGKQWKHLWDIANAKYDILIAICSILCRVRLRASAVQYYLLNQLIFQADFPPMLYYKGISEFADSYSSMQRGCIQGLWDEGEAASVMALRNWF